MVGADREALIREVGQALGRQLGGRTQLGSPGWESITCSQCKSELRYYVPPYYPYPPYGPMKCPICGLDLGVMGMEVEVLREKVWPPPAKLWECPHCDAMFTHESLLSYHILTQHGPPPPPVFGFKEWLEKYWPWALGGTLALVGFAIVASR